ncbi:hypothetical protein VF06_37450 [Nostoc linckia z4]|uniref:Uncharacterized protein n=1 Tax=Nostoc linckia z8 TaxID=1628746 RepID=A0A9Q5ZB18_NOSLI|nr:hypothetical protein [Nostoc linckia]PHJ54506.1 hypothetical protein VF02_36610 [Nostoc linckia z1]PHJ69410.1 hypothetical protein VF03_24025 [Nostoc linckia z2]PHJ70859.1 hypothetical protein VF06_37450 [Nostoc linckia z4]PHJ79672.1 hypothetical protein VF07_33350 [Nostoc linckia z6]PHK02497.1 hypothetical protein VF08_18350 [Nostoc linckia z8]
MKIESFFNGELVAESEINNFPIRPNIAQFNTQMLMSESYMKLVNFSQDVNAKGRLELLSVRLELKPEITIQDLEILKLVWDNLVNSVPDGILTEEDKNNFNEIADSNFMPFRFQDNFELHLLG